MRSTTDVTAIRDMLEVLPGATHYLPIERPDSVAALLDPTLRA